jgi:DmsE family decaheme c-type cytochrome
MDVFRRVVLFSLLCVLALAGCEALKYSKPIIPISEYEKMLVGRLDANYVGTDNCLAACHSHDKIRRDFEASTMGAQMSAKSGLPLVDCESCHGPGSLAIEGLTPEKVQEDKQKGITTACNFKTFIDIENLPPTANSLICLKCHTANATFNLHAWNASAHAVEDVTCSDCHDVHAGADLIVAPRETKDMCLKCHERVRVEFSLRSHHPVNEERVFCNDCHDSHGTQGEDLLREDTVKATCTKCHAEYEGPFVFEHADLAEDCGKCHVPHGSANNNLLITQEVFLCMQCHVGHRTSSTSTSESKGAFYTRCTDCHSTIHGTDLPSPGGKGKFIN